ncbi:MAG: endonuclease [Paludibacteraceae bacterium]|nr:endonuclease [Paludibacteraceae bacterium]
MKKLFLLLAAIIFHLCIMAETYTIVFKSNEGGGDSSAKKTALADIVLSSTYNCIDKVVSATNIYQAKDGFGIKGGTSTAKGELVLGLDDTYNISTMTVYTASFAADSSKNNTLIVCGENINWANGKKGQINPYTINLNKNTTEISISINAEKNSRWYVQKIEFEAENPHPLRGIVEMPAVLDFGSVNTHQDELPAEDVASVEIVGKNISGSLVINLQNSTYFSVLPTTLPAEGGEINISYYVNSSGYDKITDTLFVQGVGKDNNPVKQAMPVKMSKYIPTNPHSFDVDSSCMAIGPMPGDYYKAAQGQKDSVLKSKLGEIIFCGVRYKYGSGNHKTWDGFFYTDRDTTTNQVLDMYSNSVRYFNPATPTASVAEFDIEHMLPKSWWGGTVNEAYCDLYHLVPGDYSANRSKSNHAPGIPSDTTFWNGSFATGSGENYGLQKVFCPADEYKGDFARAYFYIATCYGDTLKWVTTGEPGVAMTNDSWQEFKPWLRDVLLAWHRMDPVSDKEKTRAIEVNKIQGNRNPFIDYPELVEFIWGNRQGEAVDFQLLEQSYGDEYNENPAESINTPNDVENASARKLLRDGQLLILRNASIYSTLGQRIK